MKTFKLSAALIMSVWVTSCAQRDPSISLLPAQMRFEQSSSTLDAKIDILWVMDDSGSMATSQQNVADNFNVFINGFIEKNLDFRIAVTSTGAYRSLTLNDPIYSKFRDGSTTRHSGVFVLYPDTPNLSSTFMTNIMLGTAGPGDERHFLSFKETLMNPLNSGFVREDAHLAVIMVTDEDDFSHNASSSIGHNYTHPTIHPISDYVNFLNTFTQSSGPTAQYSVSAIGIFDEQCKTLLNSGEFTGRIIARRVGELVDAVDGIRGSLCDGFAENLLMISNKILQLSTRFFLDREPIPETIIVRVNGSIVPNSDWTYDPTSNSIIFHPNSIPSQGSEIIVDFDPVTIK